MKIITMPRSLEQRILSFNKGLYAPLLNMKYKALTENPFRFFRGTAHLFWEDLAGMVDWKDKTCTWCCGDLHLENFGSYRAGNGQVYFDINDFDEAAMAPATWEVARFLVSVYAAADTWGIGTNAVNQLVRSFLERYAQALAGGKAYAIEKETTSPLIRGFIEQVEKRTDDTLLAKRIIPKTLTIRKDKGKALDPTARQRKEVTKTLARYMADHHAAMEPLDIAVRVAGTGSLGLSRYIILAKEKDSGKVLLFDLKASHMSSLAEHSPVKQPRWKNNAERIITIQRLMPYAFPKYLDLVESGKETYILRQLQPSADKFDHTLCKGKPSLMNELLQEMASALASAQIRSASRLGSSGVDALMDLAGRSAWRKSILNFAEKYHLHLLKDHAAYCKLYEKGAFKA
jgi:uncharacterized protein (DUF2252 family)